MVFLLLQEGVRRQGQVSGIDFMVEIDGITENPVQVVCHVLTALPGRGGYPHQFFLRLENNGMMSDKLIDSHLIGKSQFRSSHSFPVAEDRGGFRSIYGDVFFQQLLQASKAVGAVRSFYVFQVPFVMAEGFRLVVIGTDDLLPVSCE